MAGASLQGYAIPTEFNKNRMRNIAEFSSSLYRTHVNMSSMNCSKHKRSKEKNLFTILFCNFGRNRKPFVNKGSSEDWEKSGLRTGNGSHFLILPWFAYQRTPDFEPPAFINVSLSWAKVMLLFETAKSYTYNLTGLPPYRFLVPVSRESVFVIRYVCIAVNQGKQFLFYLVIRIHGIAEIKHSGNYSIRFLLLIVR